MPNFANVYSLTVSDDWDGSTGSQTAGSTLVVPCLNAGTIGVQVVGSMTATLQFERISGGTSWLSATGWPQGTGVQATSATAAGAWRFSGSGVTAFRVRCSSYGSGSPVVTITLSDTPFVPDNAAVNLAQVGGSSVALGQTTASASIPVVPASNVNAPVNLAQVGAASVALGQAAMAASVPVVVASNQTNVPTNTVQIGGTAVAVNSGTVSDGCQRVVLPSNVNSPVNIAQVGGASLALGQTTASASIPVVPASNVNAPVNLAQVGAASVALGQAAMAASVPVVVASNQTNLPANIAQVGGASLALGQGAMAASVPVVVASNQTNVPTNTVQLGGVAITMGSGVTGTGVQRVVLATDVNSPVNLAQVGGSNVATAASGIAKVGLTDASGTSITLGQAAMAASVPVVLASNQSNVATCGNTTVATFSYTSASSATTVAGPPVTGLGPYRSMMLYCTVQGGTGGTLDIYLQMSPDGGTTWVDWLHLAQLAAGASAISRAIPFSKSTPIVTTATAVGTGTSPALAANTFLGGDWGDRLRIVSVTGASTSAGAPQVLLAVFTT